jgi:hypothetical protein
MGSGLSLLIGSEVAGRSGECSRFISESLFGYDVSWPVSQGRDTDLAGTRI